MRGMRVGVVLTVVTLALGFSPGSDGTLAAGHPLKIKDFDVGIVADVRLDQHLTFKVRGRIRERHLGFDFFPIASVGDENPRGTFIKGRPLFDPLTGTIVVIDPDEIPADLIRKVERKGRPELLPSTRRYDVGADSVVAGNRLVLIDRSRKARRLVTFIADVPQLPDLSDAAYRRSMPYRIDVGGRRGLHEAFLTVSADDPHLFIGPATEGRPRVVHADPADEALIPASAAQFRLRFSHPLDPRTTGGQQSVFLRVVSIPGRPGIPVSTVLTQTALGTVELVVTPEQPLPPNEYLELSISQVLTNLLGHAIAPGYSLEFATGDFAQVPDPVSESFVTKDREDAAATDADWNLAVPGTVVARAGTSVAQSLWFDSGSVAPDYGTPVVDLDAGGGTIEIRVQGSREDIMKPGPQPVDPDLDPHRLHSTDWVTLGEVDVLDDYQYLRFRVVFSAGDPLPLVRSIEIPVSAHRD